MLSGLSLPLLIVIFLGAAGIVWVASTYLSRSTDALSKRWNLGQAFAGIILLSTVEDLPEVVIVVAGALSHHLGLITGNLLGGIAAQTLTLVGVDALGVRDRPLSYRSASLNVALEGLQGLVVFSLVILATQLPPSLSAFRLAPGGVGILVAWLLTTWLIRKAHSGLPWKQTDQEEVPKEVKKERQEAEHRQQSHSMARDVAVFAACAAAILVSGYALEESGNAIADSIGLSGVVFGGTILALATSLPEFSTGIASVRQGDFSLAVSEVFGSNSYLPVLFFPATIIAGAAVLPQAKAPEIYLTGLGMLLTGTYSWGLIFRPSRQYFRLGPDSIAVLLIYLLGVVGLIAVASG